MEDVLSNDSLAEIFRREQGRLRSFVRRRVADEGDAEDILQDVALLWWKRNWLTRPVEQAGAWLFRVARNSDHRFFAKKRPVRFGRRGDRRSAGPSRPTRVRRKRTARSLLWEELEQALAELPSEQRAVFIAHEIEGRSFKEIAAETGVSVNTLLSRKRYAVLHLRDRLKEDINEEIMGDTK